MIIEAKSRRDGIILSPIQGFFKWILFYYYNHINNLISEYQSHIDNRSNTNISKSSFGEDISNNISEMRHQLDILDDLVEGSLEDNTFIRDYKAARLIDDYGKGKTLKNKAKT